jgi:fibronectin type 3 domain-containing protein
VLTWTAPAGADASYRVYYGTAPGTYIQARGNGILVTATTANLTNLLAGRTYYFAVTDVDANGNESTFSNEASKLVQ